MRFKLVKYIVIAYCTLLLVSLAVFYMLPEYPTRADAGMRKGVWDWEFQEGWQDYIEGIHVREQWQFPTPGENLVVTATEPIFDLWVLVERTSGQTIEVVEYGTTPQFADLIKSYAVELIDNRLVITPPAYYELNLATFSRDFTEAQFFKGDDPGPDFSQGFGMGELMGNRQVLMIKVPGDIEMEFDETKVNLLINWD